MPNEAGTPSRTLYAPFTIGLSVVFGLIFLAESLLSGGSLWRMDVDVLRAMGGNDPALTLPQGEYWRLVSAAFLHGDIVHVAMNTYAFLIIGSAMERTLGAGWMLTGFTLSAVIGSLVSTLGNDVISIGASGGVLGLVAMAAALTWLAPRLTGFSRRVLLEWLVFALAIGFVAGFDNWGHIGGVLGGALCAGAAAALRARRDTLRVVGMAGGAVSLVVAALGLGFAAYDLLSNHG